MANDFVDLKYKPNPESDVITKLHVEAPDLLKAANEIGAESSVGTWVKVGTMREGILDRLGAKAFRIDKKNKLIHVAYPLELMEPNNVPQLLSDIAGNIFGMKGIENLKLIDFDLPDRYINTFKGPAFGRDGVRKMIGTERSRRPHVGTIVKPKVGLNPKETAKVAFEAWAGGIDFVKDDENLTSQRFCPFNERIPLVLAAMDKARDETGEHKMYAANITASAEVMLKRADYVKAHGGNCIMVDIITAGFSSLQFIRAQNFGMPIHAHRAMYAAFARGARHGVSMLAIAKLARLSGADQLHIGAVVGKMEGGKKDVLEIHNSINGKYGNLKPLFSVCSGGLAPENVPDLIRIFGRDIVIQAGGGVHGHPRGTRAGAMALRQAVDATLKGIPLKTYAKTHVELAESPGKWNERRQYSQGIRTIAQEK